MITLMDKYTIIKLKLTGLSSRHVAKELQINRKTVNKYWNEYQNESKKLGEQTENKKLIQEKLTLPPKYDTSKRYSRKYSQDIDAAIDNILASEAEKLRLLGSHKQQLSNVQIHQELISMGFSIGKTTVSIKLREKRALTKECFIRQEYEFADRIEFDFGEIKLYINQSVEKFHIAVFSSPASNFRWCYLYKNQTKDVFLDAHVNFFEMVKGVYKEVVYDNMKNVVTRFIGHHEKQLNEDLIKMSLYYGFQINVTNCFSGNEKGHVEGSVKILRNKIFGPKYKFESFEEAKDYMNRMLVELNKNTEIETEKMYLSPYKPKLELATIRKLTVDKYSFIRIENNFYSVPDYLVGKVVTAKIYYADIDIYASDFYVCTHKKIDGSKEISIDIRHYLKTFERKPGALHNSLALKSMPTLKAIYDIYFKTNPKKFIEILIENQEKSLEEIADVLKYRVQYKLVEQSPHSSLNSMTMNQLKLYNSLSIKEVVQ